MNSSKITLNSCPISRHFAYMPAYFDNTGDGYAYYYDLYNELNPGD